MAEFTKEQEEKIQRRVLEAQRYQAHVDNAITGFKIALNYINGITDTIDEKGVVVKRGAVGRQVYDALEQEYLEFLQKTFGSQPQSVPQQEEQQTEQTESGDEQIPPPSQSNDPDAWKSALKDI